VIGSEVLPISKHGWTVAGTPAAWRGARWFSTLLINRHGKHDP
jgi:hypothetical protein